MKSSHILLPLLLLAPVLSAADSASVDSVIHLRKNTNNNQVHYAVKVDEQCRPLQKKPVRAYWRVLEEGPNVTESLAFWELPGYGVKQPETVVRHEQGGEFEFRVRGVPDRAIHLKTFRQDGQCRARAFTNIGGQQALFEHIEIHVSGWANVHKVEIFGRDVAGAAVHEVTHNDAE